MSERPKCLNCGKRLRQRRAYNERPATAEELASLEHWRAELDSMFEQHNLAEAEDRYGDIAGIEEGLERVRRKKPFKTYQLAAKQTTIIEEPFIDQWGQDGIGLFCKRACGEQFGIAAARAGYRRKAS